MKPHIFFVDEDIEEMKLFVLALNEIGVAHKCTYASNGVHALKMLHYLRPEMIFINFNMSVMNGLVLIEEISKNQELKHIPVYMYYTSIDQQSLQHAIELNVKHCRKKPNNMLSMVHFVKEFFEPAERIASTFA